MRAGMALGLLAAFVATSASEGDEARRRFGGDPAVGAAGGHSARGLSPGARYGGAPRVGDYASPRGSGGVGHVRPPGAQARHPRAGTGTGRYYGRGHGRYPYHRYYPYQRYYPYGYYGYYPYYGRYYQPYWGGLGLSFYFGDAYAAPYGYVGPPAAGVAYYGGGGPGGYGPETSPEDASELQLVVVPDDASVWIDDTFRGVGRDLARLPLPPGRHRIEVVRPGFRTATEDVELRPGTATAVRIELEPGVQ